MNQPESASQNHHRYRELDAMRGIAALLVVLFHVAIHHETIAYFRFGVMGVDLFFIISGFVILMSLSAIPSGTAFVINRVSRLYPTYWTCVTFTFVALFFVNSAAYGFPADVYWKQYFGNMTMFQHYMGIEDLDGPYWTMIIEMLFYIVMLLLYYLKLLQKVIIIFFSGALVIATTVLLVSHEKAFALLKLFPLAGYLPLFLAGIIFYKLFRSEGNSKVHYTLLFGCFVLQAAMFPVTGRAYYFLEQWEYTLILAFYFVIFLLFVKQKLRFIVSRTTLFLGRISFALYLIHQFVATLVIIPLLMQNGWPYWAAAYCMAVPVVILLAAVITFWIEIPVGKKMKTTLKHWSEARKTA